MTPTRYKKFISHFCGHFENELQALAEARCNDPFRILGRHWFQQQEFILHHAPHTQTLFIEQQEAVRLDNSDFFIYLIDDGTPIPLHYTVLRIDEEQNKSHCIDPYSFDIITPEFDRHLFAEGKHLHCYRFLGAHEKTVDKIDGMLFCVWAPNARSISVVADFNHWDGRIHPLRSLGSSGIWELFIPGIGAGAHYKFEIKTRSGQLLLKADPYAFQAQLRPETASITTASSTYQWQDHSWLQKRRQNSWLHHPMSIYECHLGSWQRDHQNRFISYRQLAKTLIPYVHELGFTHIEILPITEHPLDASWGYQTTGYYAPTRRFGEADDFRYFVDQCHQHDIGVILDWVPAHFPKDAHGLARFDGTALYEHEDPRQGEHQDWGTLIYNYGRNEVKNFLISSAVFWLQEYHIDGLRVDAVASMLYLDYSRKPGQWIANKYGGNENLQAISFLKQLNRITHGEFPGTTILAEESTSWPGVTHPTDHNGLGFSMKWNMGWMHDTLDYFSQDPIYRKHHHHRLTFGLMYCFSENFVLPFSHDEVVHGKSSLINKMPGDEWQRFANLRLLYAYLFTYPGKKLLFMGAEFAQTHEWNHDCALNWELLQYPLHAGIKKLVQELNHLYRQFPALHQYDFDSKGFEWVNCDDAQHSVLSFLRKSDSQLLLIVLNFTPVLRKGYLLQLSSPGRFQLLFNSDDTCYGGSNNGNQGVVHTHRASGQYQLQLDLPPLAAMILEKQSP